MDLDEQRVVRVLVVDDHHTFAELLAGALDREPDLRTVGRASTGDEAVALARRLEPDLVLMDVQMPGSDGFEATRRIVTESPTTRVVVLTAHTDVRHVDRAASAGASAFLPKDGSLADMLATVRGVATGEVVPPAVVPPEGAGPGRASVGRGGSRGVAELGAALGLTPRELDVLALMGEGEDVRAIAVRLGITEQTCRGYVKAVLAKLGVHSQLQAVVTAWRLGLLRPDDDA